MIKEIDMPEFIRMMTAFSTTYKEAVSPAQIKIFYDTLKKYSMKDVRRAGRKHLSESAFFPKPAELVNQIIPDGWHDPLDREPVK